MPLARSVRSGPSTDFRSMRAARFEGCEASGAVGVFGLVTTRHGLACSGCMRSCSLQLTCSICCPRSLSVVALVCDQRLCTFSARSGRQASWKRSPTSQPRTAARSGKRSKSNPRLPCSNSMSWLRLNPDSRAKASCVRPAAIRRERTRPPTCERTLAHLATSLPAVCEGRMGTR